MDGNSSDSEIINRKRHPQVKKQYYESDHSSSEESYEESAVMEGDFEPLFYEIFGNGEEYKYIYDKEKDNLNSETGEKSIEEIDSLECYNYITNVSKFTCSIDTKPAYGISV